jgi:hypothetical protein
MLLLPCRMRLSICVCLGCILADCCILILAWNGLAAVNSFCARCSNIANPLGRWSFRGIFHTQQA